MMEEPEYIHPNIREPSEVGSIAGTYHHFTSQPIFRELNRETWIACRVGTVPQPKYIENSTVASPLDNTVTPSSSGIARNSNHGIFSSHKPNPRRYQCLTCGKDFDRPSRLKNHAISHLSVKPYQCLGRCGSDKWQVHIFDPLSRILTSLQHCCFLF
jgi:hypothetical protein